MLAATQTLFQLVVGWTERCGCLHGRGGVCDRESKRESEWEKERERERERENN